MIIRNAWTIDGTPAPWNILYAPSAIIAITPICNSYVSRTEYNARVSTFKVILRSGMEIQHSREYSDGRPYESTECEVQRFRDEIIALWADAMKAGG